MCSTMVRLCRRYARSSSSEFTNEGMDDDVVMDPPVPVVSAACPLDTDTESRLTRDSVSEPLGETLPSLSSGAEPAYSSGSASGSGTDEETEETRGAKDSVMAIATLPRRLQYSRHSRKGRQEQETKSTVAYSRVQEKGNPEYTRVKCKRGRTTMKSRKEMKRTTVDIRLL